MDLRELLTLLACPKCKGDLDLTADEKFYICKSCSLAYPIEDGIPVMLIDRAISLEKFSNR